ncbi:MAG: OmpA family protein [Beijerinckiaceae bacterium]
MAGRPGGRFPGAAIGIGAAAGLGAAGAAAAYNYNRQTQPNIAAIRAQRHIQNVNGLRVIREPGYRTIYNQNGQYFIRNDDRMRFNRFGQTRSFRNPDGTYSTVVTRPDGSQIVTVYDGYGRMIERRRRWRGREFTLFSNRGLRAAAIGGLIAAPVALAPLVLNVPRERYVVEYEDAQPQAVYQALTAPPVAPVEPVYSVDQVLRSPDLRNRMPRVDLDDVNFPSGSWTVPAAYKPRLARLAEAIRRAIEKNPQEVFLIEGHTDGTAAAEDNLTLSDRRAEAVAIILTQEFGVPPENLLQQGYGEQQLKVNTQAAEARNRRVAVRRITPLLAAQIRDQQQQQQQAPAGSQPVDQVPTPGQFEPVAPDQGQPPQQP